MTRLAAATRGKEAGEEEGGTQGEMFESYGELGGS